MKKKIILYSISLFIIIITFGIFVSYNAYSYSGCYKASKEIDNFSSYECIRFMIYGSSSDRNGNTISARFSIIDTNGNEITTIERSWAGSYLTMEFNELEMNEKSFIFPSIIYGRNKLFDVSRKNNRGTSLPKYYNDDNQCFLLGFGSEFSDRKYLYDIAAFATSSFPVLTFGKIKIHTLDLAKCKTGIHYSVFVNGSGNFRVVEY